MHSAHTFLLLLLWSLLPCALAAPVWPPVNPVKGLRYDNDIYTVEKSGDNYYVYTPYYTQNGHRAMVTKLIFPANDPTLITVASAWNGKEKPHRDRSPRLHLSDVIQIVADRHANRPVKTVSWVGVQHVVNKPTLEIVDDYFRDWLKLNPGAAFPERLVITPSSSFWPSLKNTPFLKAVSWTFKETGKTIRTVYIAPPNRAYKNPDKWSFSGSSMSCHVE